MGCTILRRARFSASHRYWLPEWTPEENEAHFGPTSRFPGHGHNYVLYVYMAGPVDDCGMVLNLSDVKHVIRREVTSQLDYSFLNEIWPEFQAGLPTTEHMALVIWQRLSPHLPLVRIQLYENPQLWAEYEGNAMEAYLTVGTHFSAAHRLARPDLSPVDNDRIYGKCARPHGHGHNYGLEVTVRGQVNPRTGMLVDLVALEKLVEDVVTEPLDHTFLNKDIPYFADVVPTAENIALYIGQLLRQPIRDLGAELHRIKLVESPNNACEVYAHDLPDVAALEQALALTTQG